MLVALLLSAAASGIAEAGLEDELDSRWRGASLIIRQAVASDCGGRYTDNRAAGGRITASGTYRFAAGELARVHKLDLRRARLDLLLDLEEPLRIEFRDGPFVLYRHAYCKVELEVELPRSLVREGDANAVEAVVAALVERHRSDVAATSSTTWNRRRREPFPEGYEKTLADYEAWKAAEHNREVQERVADAAWEAGRVRDRIDDDPDYLSGFAAGIERLRRESFGDCDHLLSSSFVYYEDDPPGDRRGDQHRDWRRGFEDGQKLVYYLELLSRLPRCLVPEPAARW